MGQNESRPEGAVEIGSDDVGQSKREEAGKRVFEEDIIDVFDDDEVENIVKARGVESNEETLRSGNIGHPGKKYKITAERMQCRGEVMRSTHGGDAWVARVQSSHWDALHWFKANWAPEAEPRGQTVGPQKMSRTQLSALKKWTVGPRWAVWSSCPRPSCTGPN